MFVGLTYPISGCTAILHRIDTFPFQVKSGQIHQGRGQVEQGYSLEVAGPILPHTKLRLMNLFSCTHKQFTASFSVHIPSAAFNATTVDCTEQSHDDSINEEVCNESEQLKRRSNLGKTVIKEIKYKDAKFTWTTWQINFFKFQFFNWDLTINRGFFANKTDLTLNHHWFKNLVPCLCTNSACVNKEIFKLNFVLRTSFIAGHPPCLCPNCVSFPKNFCH